MDVFTREKGIYTFGPFRLDPVRRALLRDGERIKLGARLFDTLLYLVENHDRLVERDELQQAVWQGRVVEEGNLGQAISALRKTLQGDFIEESFIVTVAGRGYRFGAPVEFLPAPPSTLSTDLPGPDATSLAAAMPASTSRLARLPTASWGLLALLLASCGALLWYLLHPAFAAPLFVLALFCLYFFRDPDRSIPDGPVAVSPADGKVVGIIGDGSGAECTRISIFLNIFDVHVNRAPIAGRIANVEYTKGQFLVASREVASVQNERNTVTVAGDADVSCSQSASEAEQAVSAAAMRYQAMASA